MGTGYTRNDTANNIADGNVINAADFDGEYDAIEAAFNATTGHTHDGTAAEGGPITVVGPVQDVVVSSTEMRPKTTNTLDLGTSSLEYKDLHLAGTANLPTVDIDAGAIDGTTIGANSAAAGTFTNLTGSTDLTLASGATVTSILDEDTMTSDSDTALATQQSIKAYVDTEIAAVPIGDITAVNAGTGLSGGGITGDVTLSIDTGTTVDLSTAQILTNKTLTAPVISTISNTGTLTLPASTDTLVGKATTDILTNKTLTSPVLNGTLSGTAFLDEDTMSSDSATAVASQQSIKAYVDSQVTSFDTLSELTDVNITTPADASLLFYDTGTSKWIDNVVSGDISIADTGVAAIGSGVIVNDDVNASAAIVYSKLSLADSIVNADINSSAAIADSKLATISTANKVSVDAVDIDGATDIGADLTTSDLIVVDDGAGGTNRKAALSRLTTYMTGQGFSTEDPTALAIALG